MTYIQSPPRGRDIQIKVTDLEFSYFHLKSDFCGYIKVTFGNVQNMKPVQFCTGFIFCLFSAILATKLNHFKYFV